MRGKILCGGVMLLVLIVALAACQAPTPTAVPPTAVPVAAPTKAPATSVPPTAVPPTAVPPTAVPPTAAPTAVVKPALYDAATAQKLWESGPHNNAYDLYKGPNTYCAMCHSPKNFDPKATVGKPPNCWSCKFPTDKEVRISPTSPLIGEKDWAKIGCYVCHDGTKYSEVAIWNQATGKYQPVATTTQLCQKCHTYSSGGSKHQIIVSGGAHSNQITFAGNRPELCTDCHDPHSMQASCSNSKCHTDIMNPAKKINGHDAAHAKVDCVACHDSVASGLTVGQDPTTKVWTTGTSATANGVTTFTPKYSHMFDKAAACNKCHFDKNPWNLWVPTPTPAPARPTAAPTAKP